MGGSNVSLYGIVAYYNYVCVHSSAVDVAGFGEIPFIVNIENFPLTD